MKPGWTAKSWVELFTQTSQPHSSVSWHWTRATADHEGRSPGAFWSFPGPPVSKEVMILPFTSASFAGFNFFFLPWGVWVEAWHRDQNFLSLGNREKSLGCKNEQKAVGVSESQSEVWRDAVCPETSPAEQFTERGKGTGGKGARREPEFSPQAVLNSEKLHENVFCHYLPPNITPDNAWDQNVFLMILNQSFRYFKGILIFLQIYSIFYLLLLSVYIISTARRTIFWHNSKQLKCHGQSWRITSEIGPLPTGTSSRTPH